MGLMSRMGLMELIQYGLVVAINNVFDMNCICLFYSRLYTGFILVMNCICLSCHELYMLVLLGYIQVLFQVIYSSWCNRFLV